MGSHTLRLRKLVGRAKRIRQRGQDASVRVFDDLEFVLLVGVEKASECCWREEQGLGDKRGEVSGQGGHLPDIGFVD